MPIFDQGYQHWTGPLTQHAWRPLAIARQGVRAQWKNRGVRATVIAAWGPALGLASMLILWGLFEQKSDLLAPFMGLIQGLPEEIRAGPRAYRTTIWTLAFHYFFFIQIFFAMILVLLVGPDLISQDLRFNAIPLYFSRPLRRIDYFLGKLGVIAGYLGAVTVVPVLLAFGLGLSFSLEWSVFRDTARVLGGALAFSLIVMVSAGTLMLAVSSLSRNSRYIGAIWMGLWVVSNIASGALEGIVQADWCPVISYTGDLHRVREALLDTESAQDQLAKLVEAGQGQVREAVMPRPFGRRRGPRPPSPPTVPGAPSRPPLLQPTPYPWEWSAGVLAGLFVVSAWVLSSRVKTLDRLK